MASYMIVRAKVRDFAEWKPGYDAHLPKREEAAEMLATEDQFA